MALPTLTFTTLVQRFAASAQAGAAGALDFTVGSLFRAVAEANAALGLWLQWLILEVLGLTRAATSQGTDLDSWMADFGVARLPGAAAAGRMTFSRFAPTQAATVRPGVQVKSADGTVTFVVVADENSPSWNGTGYRLAVGQESVTAPVVAARVGTIGNVLAGSITLLASAIPGVDTASNAAPFTSGFEPETDAALRDRFALFIAGLSKGTRSAVAYAIASLQQGLRYTILEGTASGQFIGSGQFVVTIDDGTGAPTATTLAAVYAAIDAVRPFGTVVQVQAAQTLPVTIGLNITAAPGYVEADLYAPVARAILAYVNALPIGAALSYARLVQVAFDAAPGLADVQSVLLNGGTANVGGAPAQIVRTTLAQVAVG